MLKLITIALIFICTIKFSHAQIGINSTSAAPDNSAMLDVSSTTKGMLVPRMTTTERSAISSPANGLMVYDTDTKSFWYYKSTAWAEIASSSTSALTTNYLSKWNGSSFSNSTLYDNNGILSSGTTNPNGFGNDFLYTKLMLASNSTDSSDFNIINANSGVNSAWLNFGKARGSLTSLEAVKSIDDLMNISASGYDGTQFSESALISVVTEGTVATNKVPIKFFIKTRDITGNLDTRFSINNDGNMSFNGKVGIGVNSPSEKLQVDDGNFMNTGTIGGSSSLTISGEGTRMFFYPRKAALRAGYVSGTNWDDANIGEYSTATGYDNAASASYSTTVGGSGNSIVSAGTYSSIIGGSGNAMIGQKSNILGGESNAVIGNNSSAIGAKSSSVNGQYAGVLGGTDNAVIGNYSVILGGNGQSVIGTKSVIAGGESSSVTGINSFIGAGYSNDIVGNYGFATGYDNTVNGYSGFVNGQGNTAASFGETAIGLYGTTYTANSTTATNTNDRVFNVGIGSSTSARADAMTILKSGNIGIGTSSPSYKLDVQSASASVKINTQSNTSGASNVVVSPSGQESSSEFKTYSSGSVLARWSVGKNTTTETGSNAGSDFYINRFSDASSYLGQPLSISRATGTTTIGNDGVSTTANTLKVNGSIAVKRTAYTASVTLSGTDYIAGITVTTAVTITLPSASVVGSGREYIIKSEAATANITIATTSSQTIDGASSKTITTGYGVLRVYSDGSNWFTF